MNPLTNVKNLQKMNKLELEMGYTGKKGSWHDQYAHSAWIFFGGLPYDLTEGDVITVFSQYGEVANINLVRDKKTGNSRGFGFLCYEDQRSTVLAVDNFNGTKICGRTLRVDHVADYKPPDADKIEDDETKELLMTGCAPEVAVQREKLMESRVSKKEEAEASPSVEAKPKIEKRKERSRSRSRDRDRDKKKSKKKDKRRRSSSSSIDEDRRKRKRSRSRERKKDEKRSKRSRSRDRKKDERRRSRSRSRSRDRRRDKDRDSDRKRR